MLPNASATLKHKFIAVRFIAGKFLITTRKNTNLNNSKKKSPIITSKLVTRFFITSHKKVRANTNVRAIIKSVPTASAPLSKAET